MDCKIVFIIRPIYLLNSWRSSLWSRNLKDLTQPLLIYSLIILTHLFGIYRKLRLCLWFLRFFLFLNILFVKLRDILSFDIRKVLLDEFLALRFSQVSLRDNHLANFDDATFEACRANRQLFVNIFQTQRTRLLKRNSSKLICRIYNNHDI